MKKEKKVNSATVRLNDTQYALIEKLIEDGKCKTVASAIQHIINMAIIKGITE